jgi:hypothetical protein
VVQLDGQHASGTGGQGYGNSSAAGADLNHSAAGEIADGSRDALDGLGVYEKVLAELGLGGHGLI